MTRILGALAALAGMVAFTCYFAVPVDLGSGSTTLAEATATYRSAGVAVQLLLLAALGLAAAVRPAMGARVVAVGGLGLPWMAGSIDLLWTDGVPGALRVFAGAVLLGLVVVGVAGVVGVREVPWRSGGVLLGDGTAVVVAAAVLWGLLGVNWYRVRDLSTDTLLDPRFGSVLDPAGGGGRATWVAAALVMLALVVAVAGGGWGRRVAGVVTAGLYGFEAARRVILNGDHLIPPGTPPGTELSGEVVLGLLVLPLVGVAAGAWFLTTDGEDPIDEDDDQRLAARNPSDSAEASSA